MRSWLAIHAAARRELLDVDLVARHAVAGGRVGLRGAGTRAALTQAVVLRVDAHAERVDQRHLQATSHISIHQSIVGERKFVRATNRAVVVAVATSTAASSLDRGVSRADRVVADHHHQPLGWQRLQLARRF